MCNSLPADSKISSQQEKKVQIKDRLPLPLPRSMVVNSPYQQEMGSMHPDYSEVNAISRSAKDASSQAGRPEVVSPSQSSNVEVTESSNKEGRNETKVTESKGNML